jgi:putative transposase
VFLTKHGWLRVRGNVDLLAGQTIKSATVRLDADQWYISCLIEVEDTVIHHCHEHEACGIDLGVVRPVTVAYDGGSAVAGRKASRALKEKELKRRRYQRQLARKQRGSNNREKARRRVARAYQRERNYRKDWVEKTSTKLATTFRVIIFEDLKLANMTRSAKGTVDAPGKNVAAKSGLNRELLRLGIAQLVLRTTQKAERLGGLVIKVDPKFTSQTCSECGVIDKSSRKSQAVFHCTSCGHTLNADKNAARNILSRGLALAA